MKTRKRERLYTILAGMKQRCYYPKNKEYKSYGGKGITVCEEWLNYESFKRWAIENGYNDGLTIDRIDNTKGYCPSNCRWVSAKEQSLNRTDNRRLEFNGCKLTMVEWADKLGISIQTLSNRINTYGWSVERALTEPVKRLVKGRRLGFDFLNTEYITKNKSISRISKETGIPKSTIHREIQFLGLTKGGGSV